MEKFTTSNFSETQKLGQNFAREILARGSSNVAVVLALRGDLGAGKTTFLQGFAKGLGIEEVVNSPTFVILKRFMISATSSLRSAPRGAWRGSPKFKNFYHIDCYRLEKPEEILQLSFEEIISSPENIIAIEWPEKIKGLLPPKIISIDFNHLKENKREIIINNA